MHTPLGVFITNYYWNRVTLRKIDFNFKALMRLLAFSIGIVSLFSVVGYIRLKKNNELLYYLPSDNLLNAIGTLFFSYLRALLYTFANIIKLVDKNGYLWGRSYIDTLLSPLPFYNEPALDVYLRDIFFRKAAFPGGTPPTVFGEAYINFGIYGVALTLMLVGFALSFFYRRMLIRPDMVNVIFYCFLLQFFIGTGIFGGLLIFFQYVFCFSVVVSLLIYISKRQAVIP